MWSVTALQGRPGSLRKAGASSGALAAAAVVVCLAPNPGHAASAPPDTESTKQATTQTQTIVQSQQQSVRDFVQSLVRSVQFSLQRQEEQRRSRFSGEAERRSPYAQGDDPFDTLALSYDKGRSANASGKPAAAPQSYFVSTWAQYSSDHEGRTTTFGAANTSSTAIANTWVGGFDIVKIGIAERSDAFVIGAFFTHTSSHSAHTSITSTRSISPGGGLYASYINGGYSADFSFVYTSTRSRFVSSGIPGGADTDSMNFAFNMQYKFDLPAKWWIEPTTGFSVTMMHTGTRNSSDGNIRRFQGGARIGTDVTFKTIRVEPTLTGLAYSDVNVETIHPMGTAFIGNSDKGYLWGKGVAKVNVVWTDKFSTSLEGEARGRADVFGYATRLMARYTW
jgi:hypothetical protein